MFPISDGGLIFITLDKEIWIAIQVNEYFWMTIKMGDYRPEFYRNFYWDKPSPEVTGRIGYQG